MANDRSRYGNLDADRHEREDDGYIARRGFGNRSAGYDRNADSGRRSGSEAGHGTGGSPPDRHDPDRFGQDRYGRGRSSSESFGRGSRDYHEDRGFIDRAGDEVRSWFDDGERRRDRDMRDAGQHRGRGPKGYQRSDARILEDVNDRLTEDPHIDASEIDVRVENREVTLTGTVNSRFEKRYAEDIAESVSGVTHVQNNLRIQQAADAGIGGTMMSGSGAAGAGSTGAPAIGTTSPRGRSTGGSSGSGT